MRSLLLLSTLALAPAAMAQVNFHDIYSGCTNYTSRGTVGANAGENLIARPGSHFAGICQDATGGGTNLVSFRTVTQDQNGSTPETYYLVVRKDSAGTPDITVGGLLLRAGPATTPPSTVLTPVAWIITDTLTTPSTVLPLCGTTYQGMEYQAAAWTSDGQSNHICTYYLLGTTQADNPSPPPDVVPIVAWDYNYTTGLTSQPSARSQRFEIGGTSSVLTIGNVDPFAAAANCVSLQGFRSWGAGGLWPSSNADGLGSRDDGIDARVEDLGNANGLFAVFLSDAFGCPGLPLGSLASGALYLNPGVLIQVGVGLLDATGTGIATVIPPGVVLGANLLGRVIPMQGISFNGSLANGHLSNMAGTSFL